QAASHRARSSARRSPFAAHLATLVVVLRTSQARSGPASDPDLGQSGGAPVVLHGALVAPTRRLAALHATVGFLAQHGRVAATHHRAPRPVRPASPERPGSHRLVGTNRGRLEPEP